MLKSDAWIREKCRKEKMIAPFVEGLRSELLRDGRGAGASRLGEGVDEAVRVEDGEAERAPSRGDGALARGDPAREPDAEHAQRPRRARQRSTAFARSRAIVSGPTPPGTGV